MNFNDVVAWLMILSGSLLSLQALLGKAKRHQIALGVMFLFGAFARMTKSSNELSFGFQLTAIALGIIFVFLHYRSKIGSRGK